jgi:hypothetical protein
MKAYIGRPRARKAAAPPCYSEAAVPLPATLRLCPEQAVQQPKSDSGLTCGPELKVEDWRVIDKICDFV